MVTFSSTITINSDVETVFDFVTNPENNKAWQSTFRSCKQTGGDGVEVGAIYRYTNNFLGINMQTTGVVTEFEPDHSMAFEFTSSSVSGESRVLVEDNKGKTNLTLTGKADLGFMKFGRKLAEMKAKRQMKSDLAKLKKILEKV